MDPTVSNVTITSHLLSLSPTLYSRATKGHPFLISAAKNNISNSLLSLWLSQDRIYASQAYPRFIGALVSHIPLRPTVLSVSGVPDHSQRILKILSYSLQNVVREVGFFDDTSKQWQLDLAQWKERRGTKNYTAEMARISGTGKVEEGLLFLWAMEKVNNEYACINRNTDATR